MIRPITDQEIQTFLATHPQKTGAFFTTSSWARFQEALGRTVVRFGWEDKGGIDGIAQGVLLSLPGKMSYISLPKGPIMAEEGEMTDFVLEMGKTVGALFVRCEPATIPDGPSWKKTIEANPACTQLTTLDLTNCPFVEQMHPKCRYNIRVAERHGVTVSLDQPFTDEVWALFETTAKRGGIRMHPRRYYETQLKSLRDKDMHIMLSVASLGEKPLAAAVTLDYKGVRTYLHGASGNEHRNAMAPHLLHVKLMFDACERSVSTYDWWGIAPPGSGEDHPWAGVTRFKKQFGGEILQMPGTYDCIVRPWAYRVYQIGRKMAR